MKKFSLFIVLVALLTGCLTKNEPQPLANRVAGVWKVTSIDGDALNRTDKVSFTFTKKTSTRVDGLFEINGTELDMEAITLTNSGNDIDLDSEEGYGTGTISDNKMIFWLDLTGGDVYELEATKQ
ncbi:hypothetical protein [Runella sp.]|uniref:hypothetical protein n=1 Tax=Runella sp. TaxID=1960881 RepID=UPI003015DFA6